MQNSKKPNFKSILEQEHPVTYFQERNFFLNGLSEKYSNQQRFPNIDIKRNPRLDHYMQEYQHIREEEEKKQKRKKSYLSSEQFSPIFSDYVDAGRKNHRQQRQLQQMKRDLEKMYFQQQETHQQPTRDNEYEEENEMEGKTILVDYRSDPKKKKEMYLLDLEIGRLQLQDQLQKKIKTKHQTCNNDVLMGKLSKGLLSGYMVYFDEIFAEMMDDVLMEEVAYFNYIEAEYKIEKKEQQRMENRYENMKTMEMMTLVKELDQLADQ